MKILVVHHVRSFEMTNLYLTDDFKRANEKLFGAQELDSWGGIRLLAKNHSVWRMEVCVNTKMARFINPNGVVLRSFDIKFAEGFTRLTDIFYLKSLIRYLDSSIAYFASSALKAEIEDFISHESFDVLWWDTQFYDALIPAHSNSIVRSVNFEAKHVLAEDSSHFRWMRFIGKLWSERLIARNRFVVSISPADRQNYLRIGGNRLREMPLRQLPFLINTHFDLVSCKSSILFFGSTFDVRHNRRNLESLAKAIAPLLETSLPEIRISSFGHRFPSYLKLPSNMTHFGFVSNLQGMQLGCLGVLIPFNGGAGMQSKIFEPLCLGVPILANPKNFAGYPFIEGVHYIAARNPTEYLEGVKFLLQNPSQTSEMVERSLFLSRSMFDLNLYIENLENILSDAVRGCV